jgi:pyridoxine kinase
MALALILSSYVAASRVGGMAQTLALAPFGIDPVLIPTTLFGRHPGWGPPGGGAVEVETFAAMIEGVAANGLLAMTDAVLTGYFASAEQVAVAAATIDRARAARGAGGPEPVVLVDPVMGDQDKGLYVREEVAEALARDLVPRADVVAPNLWELNRIARGNAADARSALELARTLRRPCLVTSVPAGDEEIGALYVDAEAATFAVHRRLGSVPRGTGDLFTALFAAGLIAREGPREALVRAVRGVAETVEAAQQWSAPELPIVALSERLVRPTASVRIETLS